MIRVVLLTALLYGAVFAYTGNLTPPDTILVTSLPYTMTQSNTAYRVRGLTINSTTNGLYGDALHDVVIFGDYTGVNPEAKLRINIASGGGSGYYGVKLDRSHDVYLTDIAFTVHNVSEGYGATNRADSANRIIILDFCDSIWINDCQIIPSGIDAIGIRAQNSGRSKKLDITNCLFRQCSNWFTSRTSYDASLIQSVHQSQNELDTAAGEYHWYIAHNTVERSIHSAFTFIGSDVPVEHSFIGLLVYCDSNTFTMAKKNDKYLAGEGDLNTASSAGDAVAVTTEGIMGGSHFNYNTINVSSEAGTYGGSGFLVQANHGTADYPIEYIGNRFTLSEGETPAFTDSDERASAWFFYIRRYLGGAYSDSTYNRHVHVMNNYGINYVDTATATTYIGRVYEGIRYGANSTLSDGMVIQNNYFNCGVRTDVAPTSPNGGATQIIGAPLVFHQDESAATKTLFRGNHWIGYQTVFQMYGSRVDASANGLFSYQDTLEQRIASDSTIRWYVGSGYDNHDIDNRIIDPTFAGYATADQVSWGNCWTIDSLGKSVEFWATVNLLVLGSDSLPAAGAIVSYSNAYTENAVGTTNFQGRTSRQLKWRYEHYDCNEADGYAPGDSLSFNPFTFTAVSADLSDTASVVLDISVQPTDTIWFAAAVGSPQPVGNRLMVVKRKTSIEAAELVGPPEE